VRLVGLCIRGLGRSSGVLQWARAHSRPWFKPNYEDASHDRPETRAWVRQQPE
jgi:hypothetical protein